MERRTGALGVLALTWWGALATLGGSFGVVGIVGVAGVVACKPSQAGAGQTYRVRARIAALPAAAGRPRLLVVMHEPIDHFVGHDGKMTAMDAMEMPFPLAPALSLAGFGVGDVVEVELHVDWQAEREIEITGLRHLPRGTRLDFRPPRH